MLYLILGGHLVENAQNASELESTADARRWEMSVGIAWVRLLVSCGVLVGLCIMSLVEPFWRSSFACAVAGVIFTFAVAFCLGSCAKLGAAYVLTHAPEDDRDINRQG